MSDTSSATPSKRKPAIKKPATKAKTVEPKVKATTADNRGAQWREQASEYAGQAKASARDAATTAKNTTGDALAGLSKLISDTAETVDSKLGPQYGDYARKAAETVAGAAKSLDEKDIDQLSEEARNFVRKSPAVAIGAAAVVGFVLMRMMRGNSSDD